MTKVNSTPSARTSKPKRPLKPYPDFPLFPHASGRWCKKIRGKQVYFGPWSDPDGALRRYLDTKDDLHAGRVPRAGRSELDVADLCNRFMTAKDRALAAGEIAPQTRQEYYRTCERICKLFGKERFVSDITTEDFEKLRASIAESWGATGLGNEIQRVRCIFKYGYESGVIPQPIRFGPTFKRPSRKVMRKLRAERGPMMFEASEIQRLIGVASIQMKAMILLGINAGFGNEDCATLPMSAIDLAGGWVSFPRPKTGINRRAKLWPETVQAIKDALAVRPTHKDASHAGLVFITKYGQAWSNAQHGTAITHEMGKLLKQLGIERPRLSFYGLRHSFRTIADETTDRPAIDNIMGHARDEDIATNYRERIADVRLEKIAEHVRTWLFEEAVNR